MAPQLPSPGEVTHLLQNVRNGDEDAAESLLSLAYDELRSLASSHLATERNDHTLQATALVHEAWLKLTGHLGNTQDHTHFYAIVSQAMRRVLTDHARHRNRQKRSGGRVRIVLNPAHGDGNEAGFDLVDLDDSLRRLAALNERHARVVELRVFGGLTIAEAAEVLEVSHGTIESDWFSARAWLRLELARTE